MSKKKFNRQKWDKFELIVAIPANNSEALTSQNNDRSARWLNRYLGRLCISGNLGP